MKTIIKNANIIMGESIVKNGCIVINNNKIEYAGEKKEFDCENIIDAKGGLVTPGFVNAHSHAAMTLLRNYADGYDLFTWLNKYIFPVEDRLLQEDVYNGSMLAIMEMLKSGITAFADMYYFMEDVAEAVAQSGIKAHLSRALMWFDDSDFKNDIRLKEAKELFEKYHNSENGRIKVGIAPHAVYTTTFKYLEFVSSYAKENNAIVHLHLSETRKENADCMEKYKKSPTRFFEETGIFQNKTFAAHAVHLSDEDMDIIKKNGVTLVNNPISNLKLGSGVMNAKKLMEKGIDIAIGTDGASSNNSLNMLEEMRFAGVLYNGVNEDSTLVKAADVLKWATNAGAIGFKDTGEIKTGNKADLVIFDTSSPSATPMHNALSYLVYSSNASDISRVIVDGKTLYKDGEFTTIDAEKVYSGINKSCKRLFTI